MRAGRLPGMAALLVAACSLWPGGAVAEGHGQALQEQLLDSLVRDGYERPAQSAATLRQLVDDERHGDDQRRRLLLALGSVEAQAGHAPQAREQAEQLQALADPGTNDLAMASARLVRAQVAENAGELDVAASLAQEALPAFTAVCAAAAPATPCDYRAAWRALQILQRRAMSLGLPAAETAHAQTALALVERAGDTRRQSTTLASLALLAQGRGETALADRLMARAQRLAAGLGDPAQQAKMSDVQARLYAARGEHRQALRHLEEARALASAAGAARLEGRMLTNLSDAYMRLRQPRQALEAAERALPVVRRHGDLGTERVLINNLGIAKIGVGRIAEGKADLARLMALWQRSGESGRQAETLREFGEALADAGDARSALELFHQEQALSAELLKANRRVALKELQARNEAQARQRDIDLLSRDNAAKTQSLADREQLQHIGWLLVVLMVSATIVVARLYQRVRDTHRRLAASHQQLKQLSERDPLTQLANRRHFQTVVQALAGEGGSFEGALLLVDIDHFKRLNDERGHAAGDEVLVEVAQRLSGAVRDGDLVVRWGGEEFLIVAPRASAEQAGQIAQRVLGSLAHTPVVCGGRTCLLTASIGHGSFPLPPQTRPVSWEEALVLVDRALYTAKRQGRNQAVGIAAVDAADGLLRAEGDFERALHEGRVTLSRVAGPQPFDERRDTVG